MTQHTQGPWRTPALAVYAGRTKVAQCISENDNEFWPGIEGDISPENAEAAANARLIAAAPDLLAALESAAAMLRTARRYFPKSIRNRDRFSLENTLENSVNKAIAAAKGE